MYIYKGTLTNVLIVDMTSARDEYLLKVGVTELHLLHHGGKPFFWGPLDTEYFPLLLMES